MKQILTIITLIFSLGLSAREEENYRRSSLYSMLITHPKQQFSKEIQSVFYEIPIPEKFDNHNLSVRVIKSGTAKQENEAVIHSFVVNNKIARRMMAKWFNRDPQTGTFNMDLIASRGNYNATFYDVNIAKLTTRGTAMLADAGEELIGNTFLIVNDIKYVDKSETAKVASGVFKGIGMIAGTATGNADLIDLTNQVGDLIATIEGFRVTVTSYLYRLDWNDEISGTLYESYYMTDDNYDEEKKKAFDNDSTLFRLNYVGKQVINSGKTSIEGLNMDTPEEMIQKVCTRAIDKSIAQLQQAHEEFRVKTPVFNVQGSSVYVKIGMKEGVTTKSKFEVLEQSVDMEGKIKYRRVGIIRPVSGKIWDNRYMAVEEKAEGANLNFTEFRKVSGSDFYQGMLIREIK